MPGNFRTGTSFPGSITLSEPGTDSFSSRTDAVDVISAEVVNSLANSVIKAQQKISLNQPMLSVGDLIIGGVGGAPTRLGVSTNGFVLTLVGGTLAWQAAPAGGITDVVQDTTPQLGGDLDLNTFKVTLSGGAKFIHYTGTNNTFMGSAAGNAVTSGAQNTYVGNIAGTTNSTANNGTYVGYGAGRCASGGDNTAVGACAGFSGTFSGTANVFIGHCAGASVTSGSSNTYVGRFAGRSATTGTQNTTLGNFSGGSMSTSSDNVLIGASAGSALSSGSENTMVGTQAGTATNSNCSSFYGFNSGSSTSGGSNTFIGHSSGQCVTSGTSNVAIGRQAARGAVAGATGSNNIAIGEAAIGSLTSGTSNIAIGTSALNALAAGNTNVAIGSNSLNAVTTGTDNVAVGSSTGSSIGTGINNTFVGANAGANSERSNTIAIGKSASATADAQIRLGTNTQTTLFCEAAKNTTISSTALHINVATGQIAALTSSIRYKENVETYNVNTNSLNALRAVTYNYKSDETKTKQLGLIAEEVMEAGLPELCAFDSEGLPVSVRYDLVALLLLEKVKKLEDRINELEMD